MKKHVHTDADGRKLPYRLLEPLEIETGGRYPLVVFLHGAGERGSDNEKQLIHGVGKFAAEPCRTRFPCFLVAPQCPAGERWVEVDWASDSHSQPTQPSHAARLTLEIIDQLIQELPIDPRRVYITGLSMGGYGAWDLIARRPELFAAAAIVCGGADESTAEKVKHVPVWMFHGAEDPVVTPARSRNMFAALRSVDGTPRYTEYEDVGHHSWDPAYADPELFKWLFSQRRPRVS